MNDQVRQGPPSVDPAPIYELVTAYWRSAVLVAANELRVFGLLSSQSRSAESLAAELGASTRGVRMLLDACVALKLLSKSEDQYGLSDMARTYLIPSSPTYLGTAIRWSGDQMPAWLELAQSVRNGSPAVRPEDHLGDDPEQTKAFVFGMHERALGPARGVVQFLQLGNARRLLDVGGGPGTYAMLLARAYPELCATVLDLPPIVRWAQALIDGAGLGGRVGVIGANATAGVYGNEQYDAVLMSGVLHQMGETTIRRMLGGAFGALEPGGVLIVSDMMVSQDGTAPLFSTLFSLQMLLTSAEGGVFSAEACADWMREEGFAEVAWQALPPPLPYTIVRGIRPGRA